MEGDGPSRSPWLDFQVDGDSLHRLLHAGSLVGCLGWGMSAAEKSTITQLLSPQSDADSASRVPLYVCAECGDIGCGAITADVRIVDDQVEWNDFAFENNYDPDMTVREDYRHVGPFRFQLQLYRDTLETRSGEIDAQPDDAADRPSADRPSR